LAVILEHENSTLLDLTAPLRDKNLKLLISSFIGLVHRANSAAMLKFINLFVRLTRALGTGKREKKLV
jgi:hypothetical protein